MTYNSNLDNYVSECIFHNTQSFLQFENNKFKTCD